MTNTFFEAGNDDLEEMIKSIDYGYYIAKTNNGWKIQKLGYSMYSPLR